MEVPGAMRLKELGDENRRLKEPVADQALDIVIPRGLDPKECQCSVTLKLGVRRREEWKGGEALTVEWMGILEASATKPAFHFWNQETTCLAGGHVKTALPKLFVVV